MQITLNLRIYENLRHSKNSFGFCILDRPDVVQRSSKMPYSILGGY